MRSDGLQWFKPVDDRLKSQMISTWKYIKYVWLKIEQKKIVALLDWKLRTRVLLILLVTLPITSNPFIIHLFRHLSYCAASKIWSASIILADAVNTTFNRLESSQCVALDCLSSVIIKGFRYFCSFANWYL